VNNPLLDCGKPLFFPLRESAYGPAQSLAVSSTDDLVVSAEVQSLGGMQKEALIANSRTGKVWRLASDEGAYLAGLDAAPCPLAFFTVGMVSATLLELQQLAASRGIELRQLRLVQDNRYTMTGSALQGTMRGGAQDVQLTVQAECDSSPEVGDSLLTEALARSPLSSLMRLAQPSRFTLNHNGHDLKTLRVARTASEITSSELRGFTDVPVDAGHWSELITRLGMSPKVTHTVTMAGDSLAAEQNRLLHLRGLCGVRADGLVVIDVQMFNPHGAVYRFLCDPTDGIRAPDALSYAAAGLGFCFMTQFGRFAAITRQRLNDYRILQDIRVRDGVTQPVSTRVFLTSDESDDAARQMLDIAEQTCFLHALCRESRNTTVTLQLVKSGVLPPIPDVSARSGV
jgi:uncharacterized OsmC-like protein